MGWISCCVRNGREPVRARASADIKEAPRLSAENRREAYVPESWCPPEGSPRRYILRKGAKGGVRGTARGKLRFPAWLRRSSAPPRRSSASQQAGAPRRVHPPRALAEGQRVGAWGHQRQSRRRLPTALGRMRALPARAASGAVGTCARQAQSCVTSRMYGAFD